MFHSAIAVRFSTCLNESYTLKTFLFCSSALILSVHHSRSYTGTIWSVSFNDIDFIKGGFLCLGIVLHWFSKGTWFREALIVGSIVDSCNRSTVATCPTSYCKSAVVQFIALVVILSAEVAASQRHLRAQKFSPERCFAVFIRAEEISVYFLRHLAFICCFFFWGKNCKTDTRPFISISCRQVSNALVLHMTQCRIMGKFEYTRGPIFKVVLEC